MFSMPAAYSTAHINQCNQQQYHCYLRLTSGSKIHGYFPPGSTTTKPVSVSQQCAMQVLPSGSFQPQKAPTAMGIRAHPTWGQTSVPVKWQHIPSNGSSRLHECDHWASSTYAHSLNHYVILTTFQ